MYSNLSQHLSGYFREFPTPRGTVWHVSSRDTESTLEFAAGILEFAPGILEFVAVLFRVCRCPLSLTCFVALKISSMFSRVYSKLCQHSFGFAALRGGHCQGAV